jgi:hypothetical protein
MAKSSAADSKRRIERPWASLFALWLVAAAAAPTASADAPLPAEEVTERRLFRRERRLWQRALALPNYPLLLVSWPLKRFFFWAEDVNLPDRIHDAVSFPFGSPKPDEEGPANGAS